MAEASLFPSKDWLGLVRLSEAAFIAVRGAEARDFLQGLLSQDMRLLAPDTSLAAALLTPQGKFCHWLSLYTLPESAMGNDGNRELIVIECPNHEAMMDCGRQLRRHLLREAVSLRPLSGYSSYRLLPHPNDNLRLHANPSLNSPHLPNLASCCGSYPDPCHPAFGWRLIGPTATLESLFQREVWCDSTAYQSWRIALGIPDPLLDMEKEKTLLLEAGLDELNSISWDKGCYMGQELTARTKYRALIKRRLIPFKAIGTAAIASLQKGDELVVLGKEGEEVNIGLVTSLAENWAMVRVELARLAKPWEGQLVYKAGKLGMEEWALRIDPPAWLAQSLTQRQHQG